MQNEFTNHVSDLMDDLDFRCELRAKQLGVELSMKLKTLREASGLSQGDLARKLSTTQSRVSQMEDPAYGKFSLQSLVRVAEALGYELAIALKKSVDGDLRTSSVSVSEGECESLGDYKTYLEQRPVNLDSGIDSGTKKAFTSLESEVISCATRPKVLKIAA